MMQAFAVSVPRRCSLHPYQLGEWVRPHQDGQQRSFKFYTAIYDMANPNCIFESDPEPLLKLLAKNDYYPQSPAQWLRNPRAFAFCSTENLAMLLGFHAFGKIVLNLVEIKTNLMMTAASAHPFGHFWLVAEDTLNGWVKDKTVEVAYRAFEVTTALHEPLMSSEALLKAANAAHAKKRKIELEEEIHNLKRSLRCREAELGNVVRSLEDASGSQKA